MNQHSLMSSIGRNVVCAMALLTCFTGATRAGEATLDRLRRENRTLRERVKHLQSDVKQLSALVSRLQEQKQQLLGAKATLEHQQEVLLEEKDQLQSAKRQIETEKREIEAESQARVIMREDDPVNGQIRIVSKWLRMKITQGRARNHWLRLSYEGPGESSVEQHDVLVEISSKMSGGIYRKARELEMTIDGRPLILPITGYDATHRTSGGGRRRIRRDDEYVTASMSPQQLASIVHARQVEGQLGTSRFRLTKDQVFAAKVMIKEMGGK